MESCVRCDVKEDEVRLYDAIYEGRMSSICERCSIIENIPIIKRPNAGQLKETEQGVGVLSRMKRLSGIKDEKSEEGYFREDKLKELENQPELELPEKEKLNLIEHFHWEIMKERRRKGLSHEKLAGFLGESVIVVQMIEKGKLPENAESLIRKLEQFFQIKLRKVSEMQKYLQGQKKEPVLLDKLGKELEIVPEEEIEVFEISEEKEEVEDSENIDLDFEESRDLSGMDMEKGEFDITQADLNVVRISDLRELSRKKVEATKREQNEEAKRIAERERLVEARKEELRLMKEQETSELDKVLGGTELIGGNPKREKEVDEESFDEELM